MKTALLGLTLLAVFAGCAPVGPDYKRPPANLTDAFASAKDDTQAAPVAERWWDTFDDPVLSDLIARAAARNLDLAVARARVRQARALLAATRGRYAPQVDGSLSVQQRRQTERGLIDFQRLSAVGAAFVETDFYQIGVDSSWEIDLFGSVRRDDERSKATLESVVEDRRAVLVSVLGEVGLIYIDLRGSQRLLTIAERNIELWTRTVELTEAKRSTGLADAGDVLQAKTQLRQAQAAAPPLRAQIESAAFRLAVLIGRQPGQLPPLPATAGTLAFSGNEVPVGLPSELLRRRPDIRSAERKLHAATAAVGEAKADLYPRFFLTGRFGFDSVSFGDLFNKRSRTFEIGPSIQWPLFRGGAIRANIAASAAEMQAAYAQYRQIILTAVEETERALTDYAEAELRRRSLARAVAADRQSVELARTRLATGLADRLALLADQRRLVESDRRLAESQTNVARHLVRLYKALGGGWEAFE